MYREILERYRTFFYRDRCCNFENKNASVQRGIRCEIYRVVYLLSLCMWSELAYCTSKVEVLKSCIFLRIYFSFWKYKKMRELNYFIISMVLFKLKDIQINKLKIWHHKENLNIK